MKPNKLFVVISNNKIICYDKSFTALYKEFQKLEPNIMSESYYEKTLKEEKVVAYVNTEERITYYIEKLVVSKD